MIIHIFYPKEGFAISIKRSFEPFVQELKKHHIVNEFYVPHTGANPVNMWKNIMYVRKHRTNEGVNHIAGDIHYCVLGLIGRKCVLTIHDDYAMRYATHGCLGKMQKYIFWLWLPIRFSNNVVCITETTQKNIERYCKSPKMRVICHNCVDQIFRFSPQKFNKELPTILQCGTTANKNIETLICALEGLKCNLVVLSKMSELQHKLAQEKHIAYKNYYNLSTKDVYQLYKSCDIVTFASSYEGFGMPIIEGQSTGRVVITTDKEPMNWVAGEEGAILVKNPTDVTEYRMAISKAINDDSFRSNCIKNGKENVERFSAKTVYSQYIDVYLSCFDAKGTL